MTGRQSPTDYKIQLGAALKDRRERAGLSRVDAAAELGCSEGKIRTIERGTVGVSVQDLKALFNLYGVRGEDSGDLEHLRDEGRKRRARTAWGSAIPERLRRFFDVESTALEIRNYDPELVHGMVQTEGYARAVIGTNSSMHPDDVDRMVQARMARQERLGGTHPPKLSLVLSEAVIRLRVGGADVMREQLRHLVGLSEQSDIDLRVIPFDVGVHAANSWAFTILTPPDNRAKTVYFENLTDWVFIEDPGRVSRHEEAFGELLKVALPPSESVALLATVASHL